MLPLSALPSFVVCQRDPFWVSSFSHLCYPWDISCAASISTFTVMPTTPSSVYSLNLVALMFCMFCPAWLKSKTGCLKIFYSWLALNWKLSLLHPLAPALGVLSIFLLVWALAWKMFVKRSTTKLSFLILNDLSTGDQGCTILSYSIEAVNKNLIIPLPTFWNHCSYFYVHQTFTVFLWDLTGFNTFSISFILFYCFYPYLFLLWSTFSLCVFKGAIQIKLYYNYNTWWFVVDNSPLTHLDMIFVEFTIHVLFSLLWCLALLLKCCT